MRQSSRLLLCVAASFAMLGALVLWANSARAETKAESMRGTLLNCAKAESVKAYVDAINLRNVKFEDALNELVLKGEDCAIQRIAFTKKDMVLSFNHNGTVYEIIEIENVVVFKPIGAGMSLVSIPDTPTRFVVFYHLMAGSDA